MQLSLCSLSQSHHRRQAGWWGTICTCQTHSGCSPNLLALHMPWLSRERCATTSPETEVTLTALKLPNPSSHPSCMYARYLPFSNQQKPLLNYHDFSKWPCNEIAYFPQQSLEARNKIPPPTIRKAVVRHSGTCSNSSWLITFVPMSFPLSHCKDTKQLTWASTEHTALFAQLSHIAPPPHSLP